MLLTPDILFNVASSTAVVFAGYLFVTLYIVPIFSTKGRWLDSQPWVGVQKQSFPRFRAGLATLMGTPSMVVEGYEKFSRTGKTWILPQLLSDPVVMLPAEKMQEILHFPDEQLDHHGPGNLVTQPDYTYGHDVTDGPHIDLIRRQLTRRLPLLTEDIHEEIELGLDQGWTPKRDEWTTVKVFSSVVDVVSRAANRVFSGTQLCRNPDFLEASRKYSLKIFETGFKLKLFPLWMHPIAGRIIAWPVQRNLAIAKRICVPIIAERLRNMQDPVLAKTYQAPTDALQWLLEELVRRAQAESKEIDMDLTVRQLMQINMVAIHTTSTTLTDTLLDLYSHPDADMYVEGLRAECDTISAEYNGKWCKEAVNKLIRVDSCIRETMRMRATQLGIRRDVIKPGGITLKDGTHLPYGVHIGFASHAIHRDPAFYPDNPKNWDGFRFSAPREREPPVGLTKILEQKNQSLTAVGPDYLTFGYGRHACPGRFFASQEMKLMLAHIVMKYDVRVVGGKRPESLFIAEFQMPSESAEIQIKLRER